MTIKTLLNKIDPKWHDSFIHFINTGEGDWEFFEYVDGNPDVQKILDHAFQLKSEELYNYARTLSNLRNEIVDKVLGLQGSIDVKKDLLALFDVPESEYEDALKQLGDSIVTLKKNGDYANTVSPLLRRGIWRAICTLKSSLFGEKGVDITSTKGFSSKAKD